MSHRTDLEMDHLFVPWLNSLGRRTAVVRCKRRRALLIPQNIRFRTEGRTSAISLPIERIDGIPSQGRAQSFETIRMQCKTENPFENRRGILQIRRFIIAIGMFHRPLEELFQTHTTEVSNGCIPTRDHSILESNRRTRMARSETNHQCVEHGHRFWIFIVLILGKPMDHLQHECREQCLGELNHR